MAQDEGIEPVVVVRSMGLPPEAGYKPPSDYNKFQRVAPRGHPFEWLYDPDVTPPLGIQNTIQRVVDVGDRPVVAAYYNEEMAITSPTAYYDFGRVAVAISVAVFAGTGRISLLCVDGSATPYGLLPSSTYAFTTFPGLWKGYSMTADSGSINYFLWGWFPAQQL